MGWIWFLVLTDVFGRTPTLVNLLVLRHTPIQQTLPRL